MVKYEFDKWADLYASRTNSMKSSEIRDLLSVTARSDIISLAGGLPYTKNFKLEKVVEAARTTMRKEGGAALQYGPSEGHIGLKKHIIDLMATGDIKIDETGLVITGGSQQGLDLIAKIFVDPGDAVIVEAPSYVGALNAFSAYQPDLIGVPMDENGMIVDLLEAELKKLAKQRKKAKFLYTVPNFHNPAGVTLSLSRRKRIIELSKKYQLLLVEDNPYGKLRFEGENIPSLKALDDDVVYLGTFSKIFSPGMRLGWVAAPAPILEKIIFGKQAADLCTSSFTQRLVEYFFNENNLEDYLGGMINRYRSHRDIMLKSLEEHFPSEASWTYPRGGFFVWAELPEYIDTTEMLAEAISKKVAYVPGRASFADGSGKNYMRLAFCYPEEKDIYEGIKRLGGVVKSQMSLYNSVIFKEEK